MFKLSEVTNQRFLSIVLANLIKLCTLINHRLCSVRLEPEFGLTCIVLVCCEHMLVSYVPESCCVVIAIVIPKYCLIMFIDKD